MTAISPGHDGAGAPVARVNRADVRLADRVRDIWSYRELLVGLVRKELKVKYKDSTLGFLWSMLNPALYLVVFYLVFSVFLRNGIKLFPVWLLSGLLVWNLFSTALPSATGSVVGNASIVKKVAFPREILALASVGAAMVHFFLQTGVLLAALVVFRHGIAWEYAPLLLLALLDLILLTAALGVLMAAINVYVRDAQHLLELILLAWFWMTPIVYPFRQVADRLDQNGIGSWTFLLNPVTPIVLTFQRVIYRTRVQAASGSFGQINLLPENGVLWYVRNLAVVGAVATLLLVFALRVFARLEGNFAEEL